MKRDGGVVLINALVIVLAISAVAAALLARSEAARLRTADAQGAQQLGLYLDGIERLMPAVLDQVIEESVAHRGQAWAGDGMVYPVDRGTVAARIDDLQGRLNVNWLMREDDYARDVFAAVFDELRVPRSLLLEIADFVGPGGPRSTSAYLARTPPILPRGGPLASIDDLREVEGMTQTDFAALRNVLSALPVDTRLNLNTAPEVVLKAALAPLPPELVREVLDRDGPVTAMAELRQRTMELLETEEIEHLPLERLTISSNWFRADLIAELDGLRQRRQVVFFVDPATEDTVRLAFRWAVHD